MNSDRGNPWREGEVDVNNSIALSDPVDDTEIDEVDRHLRVLDLREGRPQAAQS